MHDALNILVIEDDADTRSNLCDILALDDHKVVSAGSAEEAFALDDWPELSVVILDRKLPDGTADTLLPQIRQRAPDAAVIIVTGFADLNSTISALRLGAYDYILKPVNPDALRASLVRLVELRDAQQRALQSQRLAAIGQMITGLAHESRNALQRTQSCLEMLRLEVGDRPAALELCDRIQRAQDDVSRLYNEVRNYAAPIHLDRHEYRLDQVWRHAWQNLEESWQAKELQLAEEIDGDTACHVDPFALGQVFRNILENAIAASPPASAIMVRCRPSHHRGRPAITIAIADQGPGVPGKHRERVFEPFFTTKTKGTGLGMAIAKRIVEAHHGEIRLHASEGGAIFQITLPCHDG